MPGNYSLDYPNYDDGAHGDCTNFVSQAIYEGGKISMAIPNPLPSPDPVIGDYGWYLLNDMQRATAWNDVNKFHEFVLDPISVQSAGWTEGPEGYEFPSVPEGQVPVGLMLGDVIQYNEENDSTWEHAVIVVGFDVDGAPLVASHSPNTPEADFMTVVAHEKMRFIHIERSDGYPQVRIEIASAADDAGGNAFGSSCPFAFWDPGVIYMGGCLDIVSPTGVTSGFLFRNVQIPRGAQIKYAYVTFTTDGKYTVQPQEPMYEPISLSIAGENTATPADFTSEYPPYQRANLTSSITWPIDGTDTNIPLTYYTWNWKDQRTTPSIAPIVQTVTGLPEWTSGRSLSLIFRNEEPDSTYARRVIAYEYSTAANERYSPARLMVAYDMTSSSATLSSGAAQDGMVVESSENSGRGGMYNADSWLFNVGDNPENKQSRGILHFDTSSLPPTAVITSVVLKIKQYYISGTDPFTTHGNLVADIKKPSFGNKASLERPDFEDPAGLAAAAIFEPVPSDNWYSAILNSNAYSFINLTGTTQFRLAFTLDDNNDFGADFIQFYSGNDTTVENRPQLIVTYYVP